MRVIEVDPFSDERWERYVAGHPHGLIYHRVGWLRVLAGDYGDRFVGLLCEDAHGEVAGVLPLCHTRGLPLGRASPAMGRRLSSLPRSPIAGPLASTHEAAVALAEAAVTRVRDLDGVHLELKAPPEVGDGLSAALPAVRGETSYVLALPARDEELRFGSARNHAAIRRAVNKAARSGVDVRPARDEGELRHWYTLYLETMRKHVVPPRPYRFFRTMWRVLKPAGMMELLLAEDRSGPAPRVVAGCVFLMSGETVVFAFNGRRERDLATRPNDAIHWHAIHQAHQRGFRRYDLGEVGDTNPGLTRFKLKWGAEPHRLYRYYYPSAPSASRRVATGATRATWQRVPLSVTARVADLLYRYL